MWYTEKFMARYGIGMGLFTGLLVFAANISGSGVLHSLGYGVLSGVGVAVMGLIGARLFGQRENGN